MLLQTQSLLTFLTQPPYLCEHVLVGEFIDLNNFLIGAMFLTHGSLSHQHTPLAVLISPLGNGFKIVPVHTGVYKINSFNQEWRREMCAFLLCFQPTHYMHTCFCYQYLIITANLCLPFPTWTSHARSYMTPNSIYYIRLYFT